MLTWISIDGYPVPLTIHKAQLFLLSTGIEHVGKQRIKRL